jgi:hypothetical protein
MLEIKKIPQWICWGFSRDGRKIPRDVWGAPCGSSWRHAYVSFAKAEKAAAERSDLIGAAWVFTPEDPYIGVDLDDCLDPDNYREVLPWAEPIIDRLIATGTYFEISPSLTGIKAWLRGTLPDGWLTKQPILGADGKPIGMIELFGRSFHYFAFTGLRTPQTGEKIAEGDEFIGWLLEEFFDRQSKPKKARAVRQPTAADFGIGNQRSRMVEYAATLDIPSPGNRNHVAFRGAGGLYSIVENGQRPPEEWVFEFMREWNARLPEPLGEEELERTVRSAIESATPRAPKEAMEIPTIDATFAAGLLRELSGDEDEDEEEDEDPTEVSYDPVCETVAPIDELSTKQTKLQKTCAEEIVESIEAGEGVTKADNRSTRVPPPPSRAIDLRFPAELLEAPGFIREFVDLTLKTSIYPQEQFALSTALAFLGVLAGRKVAGPMDVRTNLYALHLAPTSTGKEWPRGTAKWLQMQAGLDVLGSENLGSGQGLFRVVAARPSILLQIDEIGSMLSGVSDRAHWLKAATRNMLVFYSSATSEIEGDAVADLSKIQKIDQPCLSIIGTSTPEALWSAMKVEQVLDGLIPRMLLVKGGHVDYREDWIERSPEMARWLIEECRWWSEEAFGPTGDPMESIHPQPRRVPFTELAKRRWIDHTKQIAARRKKEGRISAAIWGRAAERSVKLGLLFALSRDRGTYVELEDIDRGILLSNWTTRLMIQDVRDNLYDGETQVERDLNRFLMILYKHPQGMTSREVTRKTQWLKQKDRTEILNALNERGDIVYEDIEVPRKHRNGAQTGTTIRRVIKIKQKRKKA